MEKIICFLIIISLASCHQVENKKMDKFIKGEITKIKKNKNSYSLLIKTSRDSTVMATIMNEDFSGKKEILQQVDTNKYISFKGTIFYLESKKSSEKSFFQTKGKDKLPITVIKEIKYLN